MDSRSSYGTAGDRKRKTSKELRKNLNKKTDAQLVEKKLQSRTHWAGHKPTCEKLGGEGEVRPQKLLKSSHEQEQGCKEN